MRALLLVLALLYPTHGAAQPAPAPAAPGCIEDLDALVGLVQRNYAGYADKLARYGADAIAAGPRAARARIERGEGPCTALLAEALAPLRDSHLFVTTPQKPLSFSASEPPTSAGPDPRAPRLELLSDSAALISAPSFFPQYEAAFERLIAQHRAELGARRQLIIDVRQNDGGSDSSYASLAALLYSGPLRVVGVEAWATPENIAARERLLTQFPPAQAAAIARGIEKMRGALGRFVAFGEDYWIERDEVLPRPARVAVLIAGGCGSSCEQFLLEARESSKVVLFGAPSAGVLDYGNLGPHPLPSGATLWIPTTRSRRLPAAPVDGIGVPPDVAIDPARFDGPQRAELLRWVLEVLDDPDLARRPPRAG